MTDKFVKASDGPKVGSKDVVCQDVTDATRIETGIMISGPSSGTSSDRSVCIYTKK